jgi:hypothetical protein
MWEEKRPRHVLCGTTCWHWEVRGARLNPPAIDSRVVTLADDVAVRPRDSEYT